MRLFSRSWRALALVIPVFSTACDSAVVDSRDQDRTPTAAAPSLVTFVQCDGDRSALTVECRVASPEGTDEGGPSRALIVGNQGQYVTLASSNVAYDSGTESFTFDVTITNQLPQPLGTADGSTLSASGVRAFFHSGPDVLAGAGSIAVQGDGTDTFTGSDQPYYQYNEIIPAAATSGAKTWTLSIPTTVTGFTFGVYISADVEHPNGYIEVGVDSLMVLTDDNYQLTPTVRTATGVEVPGATMSFASSDSSVAAVDASGMVTAMGIGYAAITVSSDGLEAALPMGVCAELAAGEALTVSIPAGADLCIEGSESSVAEFAYMPTYAQTASSLSLSVTGSGIQGVSGPPTPYMGATGASFSLSSGGASPTFALTATSGINQSVTSIGGRKLLTPNSPSRLIVPGVPSVGDLWSLNVAPGCSGTRDDRTGQVRSVRTNVIVVADTANPAGGFTTAQYDSIALEVDTLVYNTLTTNFGTPTDLDGNDRIVLFYTRAVNELSPPASSAVTSGYADRRDLFSSAAGSCERSNEGEIIYALVPDPTGAVNSNVRTVSYVRGSTIAMVAGELQKVINSSRRLYIQEADFEEPWLLTGLSRIAEELIFYRTSFGLTPGGNIALSTLTTGPFASRRVAAFNTYANSNFGRLRGWLQRPDTTGAFSPNSNSLAAQGALWSFLRYAADRVGTSNQDAFWKSLIDSDLTGTANISAAIGADADEWLRDWVAAMYADDAVAGISSIYTNPSWNFRSVYGGLGGVPIGIRALSNNTSLTLSYGRGGSTAYHRFGIPTGAHAKLSIRSGGEVPAGPLDVILVRTK